MIFIVCDGFETLRFKKKMNFYVNMCLEIIEKMDYSKNVWVLTQCYSCNLNAKIMLEIVMLITTWKVDFFEMQVSAYVKKLFVFMELIFCFELV